MQSFVSKRVFGRISDYGTAGPLPQGDHLASLMRRVFKRQGDMVLAALASRGIKADGDEPEDPLNIPPDFFNLREWNQSIAHAAAPVLEIAATAAASELLHKIGAGPESFRVVNRNIPAAIDSLSLKFADSTNATTSMQLDDALAQLRNELQEGIVTGDGRRELRDRVMDVFDTATKKRAQMIAQSETSRAIHRAELMGASASGVVKKKQWLASADACPFCQEYMAIGPIDLDALFADLGGDYGQIDGPPGHPNCQCTLLYVLKDGDDVQTHTAEGEE